MFATSGGVSIQPVDDSKTIQETLATAAGRGTCSGIVGRLETIGDDLQAPASPKARRGSTSRYSTPGA